MDRFCRLLDHFANFTLLDRIQWEWRKQMRRRRLKIWQSQIGKGEYCETKIQKGVRMRLHFDSKLAQAIYCDEFERKERQFLNTFLRQGDVFVDVGANIGLFSLVAARHVGQSGKVYAFEPTANIYDRLCENVQLNQFNNILCFQLALSDMVLMPGTH
jgi:tRNA G37 N-methylase Trm5